MVEHRLDPIDALDLVKADYGRVLGGVDLRIEEYTWWVLIAIIPIDGHPANSVAPLII